MQNLIFGLDIGMIGFTLFAIFWFVKAVITNHPEKKFAFLMLGVLCLIASMILILIEIHFVPTHANNQAMPWLYWWLLIK